MNKFVVFVDSAADMYTELRKKYDIEYVKMDILVGGKPYAASLDWDLYTPQEFFDWLRNKVKITTTQATIEEYTNCFEKYLKEGRDVLYIGASSALSGSVNTSFIVADELNKKYPDNKLICVDSLISCFGQALLAIKAAELRDQGKTLQDTAKEIEECKSTVHQWATVATLDYLKRSGRVTASKAFFGNLFGVKPIIISDAIGQNYACKKIKGRRNSLLELIAQVKEKIVNPEEQTIFIGHADCIDDAEFLKEQILKEIPCKETYVDSIGPIIGSTTGPGTVGIFFFGKKVTIIGE